MTGTNVGSVYMDSLINLSPFNKGLKSMNSGAMSAFKKTESGASMIFGRISKMAATAFSVVAAVNFGKSCVNTFKSMTEAESKLAHAMKLNLGATAEQIKAFYDLSDAYQNIGTVSATAQQQAMQELSTYITKTDSLKTLLPVMNDLTAQQYGYNASSENARGIAQMFGKVLDGQTGALSRNGFRFDEAQEKIFKYGTEEERVALLAQVVSKYVGGMNEALGRTPIGRMQQLSGIFDNIKREFGSGIMAVVGSLMGALNALANKILFVAKAFNQLMQSIFGKTSQLADVGAAVGESAAAGMADLTEETKAAGKAARGALAPFDEINNLATSSGESGTVAKPSGAGSAVELPGLEDSGIAKAETAMDGLLDKIKSIGKSINTYIAEPFKKAFKLNFDSSSLGKIQDNIKGIKESLSGVFANPELMQAALKWVSSFSSAWGAIIGKAATIGADFVNLLAGSVNKWLAEKGPGISESLVNIFNLHGKYAETIANAFSGLGDIIHNVLQNENLQNIRADIFGIFSDVGLGIAELGLGFATSWIDAFTGGILDNSKDITDAVNGTIDGVAKITDTLSVMVSDTMQNIKKAWETYGKPAFDNFKLGWSSVVKTFTDLYNQNILPVINGFADKFRALYDKRLKPIITNIINRFGEIGENLSLLYKDFIAPFIDKIVQFFAPLLQSSLTGIGDSFLLLIELIGSIASDLMDIFSGIIAFITGVFTGDWEKAWDGVVAIFKGIFNLAIDIFEGFVNGAINLINGLINGINNISGKIGIPAIPAIPKMDIPRLAKGGVINQPTIAMVGERGREAVMPLENNTGWITELANQIGMVIAANGSGGTGRGQAVVMLNIDGKKFAEATIDDYKSVGNRRGVNMIPQTI